jgi:hypothetical protein
LPQPRSLVVDTNENLRDVLFRGLLIVRRGSLPDVDGRKPVIRNRMGAIQIALDGVLVFLVNGPPLVP